MRRAGLLVVCSQGSKPVWQTCDVAETSAVWQTGNTWLAFGGGRFYAASCNVIALFSHPPKRQGVSGCAGDSGIISCLMSLASQGVTVQQTALSATVFGPWLRAALRQNLYATPLRPRPPAGAGHPPWKNDASGCAEGPHS